MKKMIFLAALATGLSSSCKKNHVYQCIDQSGLVNGEVTARSDSDAMKMCTANNNGDPSTITAKRK